MIWSAIAATVSSVTAAVSSAVSSIGPAVSRFCTNVLPRLAPYIEKGMEVLQYVGKVAQALLSSIGIFKPDDKTAEVGERALQAAEEGIRPDGFDSFPEYMEALRKLELNPENKDKFTPEQKMVAGLAVGAKGLEDKFNAPAGSMGNLWVLAAASPLFFNADRLEAILKTGGDIASVMRYFEGDLSLSEARGVETKLLEAERSVSPGTSDESVYASLDKAREAIRESSK